MSEKFKAIPKPEVPGLGPALPPVSIPSVNAGGGVDTNPEGGFPDSDTELRRSEALRRIVLDSLQANVAVLDASGTIVTVNEPWRRFARENGVQESSEAFEGANYLEVLRVSSQAGDALALQVLEGLQAVMNGTRLAFESDYPCNSPTKQRWFRMQITPLTDGQGGAVVTHENITALKQAEAESQGIEKQLRLFIEHAPAAIAMLDTRMNYLMASDRWLEDYGLPKGSIIGRNHYEVFPEIPQRWIEVHQRCLAGAVDRCEADPFPRANGTTDWVRWEIRPWNRMDGSVGGLLIFSEIITARKSAEEQLLRSQAMLSRTEAIAHLGSWEWEVATDTVTWSDEMFRILQRDPSKGAVPYAALGEIYPPEDMARLNAAVEAALKDGLPYELELRTIRSDGGVRNCLARGIPELGPQGKVLRLFGSLQDVTELREKEEALRRNEERLRVAINTMDMAVFNQDLNLRYTWMYSPQLGYSTGQVIGRTDADLLPSDLAQQVAKIKREVLETGQARHAEVEGTSNDRKLFFDLNIAPALDRNGQVIGITGSSLNIADRKEAEEGRKQLQTQVEQLQRLESIGQLAGGVAHEINNVLASIMAVSSLLQRRGDEVTPQAELILKASRHGRDIVKALLDFSQKRVRGSSPVDLNDVVGRQTELLSSTTRQKVRIQQNLQQGLPMILAEESALASAIMNLCLNAIDAMPDGGTLTLRTRAGLAGGVHLSVEDTGQGMTEEVRLRAMEPFFTTKPFGKGTGLGLSTVYGMVHSHGGTIDIKSSLGLGTQVLLGFPSSS